LMLLFSRLALKSIAIGFGVANGASALVASVKGDFSTSLTDLVAEHVTRFSKISRSKVLTSSCCLVATPPVPVDKSGTVVCSVATLSFVEMGVSHEAVRGDFTFMSTATIISFSGKVFDSTCRECCSAALVGGFFQPDNGLHAVNDASLNLLDVVSELGAGFVRNDFGVPDAGEPRSFVSLNDLSRNVVVFAVSGATTGNSAVLDLSIWQKWYRRVRIS